jgi:16S rRNA (uracil1498-N3)-methyltransferase
MADRFYTPHSFEGPTVELDGPEAHHLMHVLRKAVGQEVLLFDGRGTEATAKIVSLAKKTVELRVLSRTQSPEEAHVPVILGTAVPKGDRAGWLVEKVTELGVDRLVPLETARSIVHPGAGKLEKMRQTVIAACKQSGRSRLLQVDPTLTWNEFIAREFPERTVLVADPAGAPIEGAIKPNALDSAIVLAIGPEGGFTDEEITSAVEAGARLISLGPRILRIETAAVAFSAVVAVGMHQ